MKVFSKGVYNFWDVQFFVHVRKMRHKFFVCEIFHKHRAAPSPAASQKLYHISIPLSIPKIKKLRFLLNLIVTASRRADPPSYYLRRLHAINFFSRHRVRSLAVTRFPYCQGYPVSAYRQRLCILGRSTKLSLFHTIYPESVRFCSTIYHQKSER